MSPSSWLGALVAACALHAGFQLVVTVLVYPALSRVPREGWGEAHRRHSRAITPLVALVYASVVATCAGCAVQAPSGGVWVAVAASATAVGVTAARAAPTHARLASGATPRLLRRLLVADRVRCAAAVVALGGALAAALDTSGP